MIIKRSLSFFRFARSRARHLLCDRSAASGVEFALVLPILVMLLFGTVDLGHALTVSRKIDEIASSTGDMISQQGSWTKSDVAKLLSGASFILQPYDTTGLTITLAVDDIAKSGSATVNWSAALNTSALTSGSASTIEVPSEIQDDGVQVVLTRVQYTLTTPVSAFFSNFTGQNGYSFDRHYFNRPRVGDTITYN
ncbi:TadE/TadG family type IV pilus assembly protein [Rhizobium johnstonii]|uniref:TadE-like domain-containing protein n=2 Tax=Rhizobium TaxID=379 RepID=Q1M440_RHIJ3|nr:MULTISPECIES: TadE/TadG family type IV pilus assembly protein [Rhizobium]MBB4510742.1 Flp pilus assembly protein TadG [Rhizobium leguminosarum]MBY5377922.1 pilus assembly protein [Rhizobium leguminosarum]MBY5393010.1 pilus assembly protein [Rhizobium leguminosarum]MBY5419801.1 pilus assembly protein [Rhizobium leguminosarum]MBY5433164.1 pilus assembly protein [Rhizobium leguminosarum]